MPNGDYSEVIRRYRPQAFQKGEILHVENGQVFGEHDGIINYTLGQRRGIGIAYKEPLYVIKIDPKTNQVFVGEDRFLNKHQLMLCKIDVQLNLLEI